MYNVNFFSVYEDPSQKLNYKSDEDIFDAYEELYDDDEYTYLTHTLVTETITPFTRYLF